MLKTLNNKQSSSVFNKLCFATSCFLVLAAPKADSAKIFGQESLPSVERKLDDNQIDAGREYFGITEETKSRSAQPTVTHQLHDINGRVTKVSISPDLVAQYRVGGERSQEVQAESARKAELMTIAGDSQSLELESRNYQKWIADTVTKHGTRTDYTYGFADHRYKWITQESFYQRMYTLDEPVLKEISTALTRGARTNEEKAEHILRWIQGCIMDGTFVYERDHKDSALGKKIVNSDQIIEFFRHPIETLYDRRIDCEDLGILFVTLCQLEGIDACLMYCKFQGGGEHVFAGVAGNFEGISTKVGKTSYFHVEPTLSALHRSFMGIGCAHSNKYVKGSVRAMGFRVK